MLYVLTGAVLLIFCSADLTYGQEDSRRGYGQVRDAEGVPIDGATVKIGTERRALQTDEKGRFEWFSGDEKAIELHITAMGKTPLDTVIVFNTLTTDPVLFVLKEANQRLETVQVLGLTQVDQVNKEAFNVTAIDAKKWHNLSSDVGQLFNRVSGVKFREAGGMGSASVLSLNGFSGNQVKMFLDGLPFDNYGSSFQLNNIPINYIDHIEVYKGVVPIWLGGDALGGAINLVKNTRPGNYLDVSYSYGSFNTHRATLNAGFIGKKGFTVELMAYKNYADNNYWVEVDVVPDLASGVTVKDRVRRFHDQYDNQLLNLNVGFSNKKWADQFLLGFNIGNNHADIQTGNRMAEVYGARFREGNLLQPTLLYNKKNFLLAGLDVNLKGSFNFGEEKLVDTVYRRFNWYGESVPKGNNSWDPGGERTAELYRYKNNNGNAALNLKYTMNEHNVLYLNNTFTSTDRKGTNELQPDNDFYKQPKIRQKNILGFGLGNSSLKNFDNNVFVKYYYQHVKSYQLFNGDYSTYEHDNNYLGYGLATSYHLTDGTLLKFSYEKAYRLPEVDELFGDVINLDPNPTLKPEHSHNFNLNVNRYFSWREKNGLMVNGGVIYRQAKDFIRYVLSAEGNDNTVRQVAQNQRDVDNLGFDAEVRYAYNQRFFLGATMTYQNLRNKTKYGESSTDVSIFYKDRIPNIPYLFGNADAAYSWKDVGMPNSQLTFTYTLFYVHDYFLRWPSAGSSGKEVIPQQFSHDASITYAFANGKYNIGIEGRNLTDALLYDNYMLQKPSRNFNVKFRYVIR